MKKIFFNIIFLILFKSIIGQNLIPNASFDSLIKCPDTETKSRNSLPIYNWVTATTEGTPDVYNLCATEPWYGMPINRLYSYQQAHNGLGYAGIFVYDKVCQCREYIETPLISALEKNQTYFVRFYVSPENDSRRSQTRMTYIDGIGLNFTDTIFKQNKFIVELKASIENRGKLIKDTTNWTPICGIYKAKGGEKYATIGNFRSDAETLIQKEDLILSSDRSYFYLDDVSVHKFNPLPDTVILCPNETLKFNAAFLDGRYKWNTGSTDSIITINKAGVFTIVVTIDNCILTDTVVVISNQNNLPILRGDTILCQGKEIILKPNIIGQYEWSTGAHDSIIMVNKTNNYAVTVTNRCGIFSDDVNITFKKCDCSIYVPNAFSPNNDGINDELQVYLGCDFNYKIKRFQVFNRWGSPVFSSHDTNDIRWNGQVNGQQLLSGVYVWYLEYEVEIEGKMKNVIESGDFTIVF